MSKDDIIRMAQECHLIGMRPHLDGIYQESLERFAAIVAAAEREACAKVVWNIPEPEDEYVTLRDAIAFYIRARSNT